MKIYQVHIAYMEPAEAEITCYGENEEDAINKVRNAMEQTVGLIEIKGIKEVADIGDADPGDLSKDRPLN